MALASGTFGRRTAGAALAAANTAPMSLTGVAADRLLDLVRNLPSTTALCGCGCNGPPRPGTIAALAEACVAREGRGGISGGRQGCMRSGWVMCTKPTTNRGARPRRAAGARPGWSAAPGAGSSPPPSAVLRSTAFRALSELFLRDNNSYWADEHAMLPRQVSPAAAAGVRAELQARGAPLCARDGCVSSGGLPGREAACHAGISQPPPTRATPARCHQASCVRVVRVAIQPEDLKQLLRHAGYAEADVGRQTQPTALVEERHLARSCEQVIMFTSNHDVVRSRLSKPACYFRSAGWRGARVLSPLSLSPSLSLSLSSPLLMCGVTVPAVVGRLGSPTHFPILSSSWTSN